MERTKPNAQLRNRSGKMYKRHKGVEPLSPQLESGMLPLHQRLNPAKVPAQRFLQVTHTRRTAPPGPAKMKFVVKIQNYSSSSCRLLQSSAQSHRRFVCQRICWKLDTRCQDSCVSEHSSRGGLPWPRLEGSRRF